MPANDGLKRWRIVACTHANCNNCSCPLPPTVAYNQGWQLRREPSQCEPLRMFTSEAPPTAASSKEGKTVVEATGCGNEIQERLETKVQCLPGTDCKSETSLQQVKSSVLKLPGFLLCDTTRRLHNRLQRKRICVRGRVYTL